jgi:hypothetical protein
MPIDYDLDIATSLSPETLLGFLTQNYDCLTATDGYLYGPGIGIAAITLGERNQSFMEEMFGFRPTVSVSFSPFFDENHLKGAQILVGGVSLLLSKEPGDAVLLHNGENLLLQRIGAELAISKRWWSNWIDPYHLDPEITLPYVIRDLPSPLLQ